MGNIIEVKQVEYSYASISENNEEAKALDNIDLEIAQGKFIAILGKNGSGKSTLAKNLNALILPTKGKILVMGNDTADEEKIWEIRENAGMVFQNPDNQIVSSIVEEDVAFGPENIGLSTEEIRSRVDDALKTVNMWEFREKAPHMLSGGQKQRIAIAGVLAMKPACIIFDEPTAMLDPEGRKEVMSMIHRLHQEGITIVLITHFMEEASEADEIIVMREGKIVYQGIPSNILSKKDEIEAAGLELPMVAKLGYALRERGMKIPENIINSEEMVEFICQYK